METRASIFLDLDGLLVRSYAHGEHTDPDFLADAALLFNGVVSKRRPHVDHFLEVANGCGRVFLFTAAQPGYARSVLKAFGLTGHFAKSFSGVYHGPRTVADELKLWGTPWILVDDSPPDHATVRHKLASLGLVGALATEVAVERHYLQVASYQPHLGPDSDLLAASDALRERVRRLEKSRLRVL